MRQDSTAFTMRGIATVVLLVASTLEVHQCFGSIVMTGGGLTKVILGYSIPIDLPTVMSINYVHSIQFQYTDVTNASQVSYVQQGARGRGSVRSTRAVPVTRKHIYSVIEHILDRRGLDRSCLLRSICESSAAPVVHSGLLGELFQTLLTPYDPDEDSDYSEAWRAGHGGQDCLAIFPLCPRGHTLLDHVSYYM